VQTDGLAQHASRPIEEAQLPGPPQSCATAGRNMQPATASIFTITRVSMTNAASSARAARDHSLAAPGEAGGSLAKNQTAVKAWVNRRARPTCILRLLPPAHSTTLSTPPQSFLPSSSNSIASAPVPSAPTAAPARDLINVVLATWRALASTVVERVGEQQADEQSARAEQGKSF